MNTSQTSLAKIRDRLNADDAFELGLSNRDAALVGDCVNFSFPAPVTSGACRAFIRVYPDGRVFDDVTATEFPTFAEWLADFELLVRTASE